MKAPARTKTESAAFALTSVTDSMSSKMMRWKPQSVLISPAMSLELSGQTLDRYVLVSVPSVVCVDTLPCMA